MGRALKASEEKLTGAVRCVQAQLRQEGQKLAFLWCGKEEEEEEARAARAESMSEPSAVTSSSFVASVAGETVLRRSCRRL